VLAFGMTRQSETSEPLKDATNLARLRDIGSPSPDAVVATEPVADNAAIEFTSPLDVDAFVEWSESLPVLIGCDRIVKDELVLPDGELWGSHDFECRVGQGEDEYAVATDSLITDVEINTWLAVYLPWD